MRWDAYLHNCIKQIIQSFGSYVEIQLKLVKKMYIT